MSSVENKPASNVAGQVSEHLAWYARRAHISPATTAPHASTSNEHQPSNGALESARAWSPLLPLLPVGAETSLSEEEWRAMQMLYEQKMAPPPKGAPFLTFMLNKLHWGVPASYLREVLPNTPAITPLPFSPRWLYGIINLRGEPVGLVHLAELLLDPVTATTVAHRTARSGPVVIAENEDALLGLLVEELGEVVFIEDHLLGEPPADAGIRALPSFAMHFLQAVYELPEHSRTLLLLDLPRLMTTLLQELTVKEGLDD
jgi:chemotaxis signal transduction protein